MFGVPSALLCNRLKLCNNNLTSADKEVNVSIDNRTMQESYAYSNGGARCSQRRYSVQGEGIGGNVP